MMEFLQVTDKKSEIGFYSGLVDSTFAFGQLMTAFHWGRLSDRIGRLVFQLPLEKTRDSPTPTA